MTGSEPGRIVGGGRPLRLSRAASVVCTGDRAILHSPFGTLVLEGKEAASFVGSVLPDLDGTRTATELEHAASRQMRAHLLALLDVMERHGVLEPAPRDTDRWHEQECFFSVSSTAGAEAQARVREARVLAVGLEPWAALAVSELAAAGVGVIRLVDDQVLDRSDLIGARCWSDSAIGKRRPIALQQRLADAAPWCSVTASRGTDFGAALADELDDAWDLVIGGLPPLAIARQLELSRLAVRSRQTTLFASVQGFEGHVGPVVVKGDPPCWDCSRQRLLANEPDARAARIVHASLTSRDAMAGQRIGLAPMVGLVGHAVAVQALQLVAGTARADAAGRLLVLNLVTLASSEHRIVPLPWCKVCGGAADGAPLAVPDWEALSDVRGESDVRRASRGWVDARTGVISRVSIEDPGPEAPTLPFAARARLSTAPGQSAADVCGGKGTSRAAAVVGAVAEGIERYSAARAPPEGLERSRLDRLTGDVLDPRRLVLYRAEQYARAGFPYERFDPASEHLWTAGRWADDGKPVWAPALMSYYCDLAGEQRYVQVTSNGLAAGRTYDDAARRAMFELVERDALLVHWLCRRPAARLLLDDHVDPAIIAMLAGLKRLGAEVRLHRLDAGLGIPIVLCIARGDGDEWPGATLALAAHPSTRLAVRGAVLEQGYSGPRLRAAARARPDSIPARAEAVATFLDHGLFYAPPERAAACDFLDAGEIAPVRLRDLCDPPDASLRRCGEWLRERGARVALVDVTAPDVRAAGFAVVRALAEGLQPLHCGYGLERSENPRLRDFAEGELNRDVHPMS